MATEKPTYLRRRKPGDLGQLKRVLWGVLIEMETEILFAESVDTKVRCANSLAQISGSYLKALELTDVKAEIDELKAIVQEMAPSRIRRLA